MPGKLAGVGVHVLTASGAVCGLMALGHAAQHEWSETFLWLGLALIIDGVDGPLARRAGVRTTLPRFSGTRLDLIVDYLNYCVVPAYIVYDGDIVPEGFGLLAGALILLSSLFHFADRQTKTEDGYFVGFPAAWNVVCLYLFVLDLTGAVAFVIILVLSALVFVPIKWLHPVRAPRLRPVSLVVTIAWGIAAVAGVLHGFPAPAAVQGVFLAAALYMLSLNLFRTLRPDAFGR